MQTVGLTRAPAHRPNAIVHQPDSIEKARKVELLDRMNEAARAYGRVYAAVAARGRKARGARAVDLLIAAIAASTDLPLCTRNPDDFAGLEGIVTVIGI